MEFVDTINEAKENAISFAQVLESRGVNSATINELTNLFDDAFILTDPDWSEFWEDNTVCWVSDGFQLLTGYRADQILHRNCRFLQGPATDPADVNRIRELIAKEQAGVVKLINYTSSGRQFMNTFSLIPLQDSTGKVVLYLGAQCEASFPNVDKLPIEIKESDSVGSSVCDSIHVPKYYVQVNDALNTRIYRPDNIPMSFLNEYGYFEEGRMILWRGYVRGTFLIKTISPSDIHSQVAAHFEVQLQFTMLCDLPVGMQVVIGMEDLKQSNIIDVHLVARALLECIRLFSSTMHYSFGVNNAEHAHIVFPFSQFPDKLIVSAVGVEPPILSHETFNTQSQSKHHKVYGSGNTERMPYELTNVLQRGESYTLVFGTDKLDIERWSIVRLPGIANASLKNFWCEQAPHLVCYAIPADNAAAIHNPAERILLFDIMIGHDDLHP